MTSVVRDPTFNERQARMTAILLEPVYGSLDVAALAELEEMLLIAIDDSATGILIDLGNNSYIGCGFLGVLLRCYRRAERSGRVFWLCDLSPFSARVLTITHLDSLWSVVPTRQPAIEVMQRSAGASHVCV